MPRSNRSHYNPWLLNVAAYLTLVAVAYSVVPQMPGDRLYWALALFIAFGVLVAFYPYIETRSLLVHLYLAAQTAVIFGVYALAPGQSLDVQILFFVLSAQAMLFLSTRLGIVWILAFFAITLVGGVSVMGWSKLPNILTSGGGYGFFGAFGAALRQADAARRRSQELLEELQVAHHQLQDYAAQTHQLAVAEERNRIAREMHDSLGHRLTVAVVQLEGAQRLIPNDPERAADMVGAMREQLKEALSELRRTVATLRAPVEDERTLSSPSLAASLQQLVRTFQDATNLTVHLRLPRELPKLPMPQQLALYRAAQEALTNVQRHANARQAWVEIQQQDSNITLSIQDDGRGFAGEVDDGRFGLRGLRERAEELGGRLHLETRPEGGAKLQFSLPCCNEESA